MGHKAASILILLGATSFSGLSAAAAERSFAGRWQQTGTDGLSVSITQSGDVVSIFSERGWCNALLTPGSNRTVASGDCMWSNSVSRQHAHAKGTFALSDGVLFLSIKPDNGRELKATLRPHIPPTPI